MARLGSKDATPGGGGAAALTGASAAGLVTMVARLTQGRPAYVAIEEQLQGIIREGDRLRGELLAAADTDATAFEAVMEAYGLPRATDDQKATRQTTLQAALVGATESPLNIARKTLQIIEMAAVLAESGNPQTITDAGTAAVLAQAALQGAIFQAQINLKAMKDRQYVATARVEIESLTARADLSQKQALKAVEQKL